MTLPAWLPSSHNLDQCCGSVDPRNRNPELQILIRIQGPINYGSGRIWIYLDSSGHWKNLLSDSKPYCMIKYRNFLSFWILINGKYPQQDPVRNWIRIRNSEFPDPDLGGLFITDPQYWFRATLEKVLIRIHHVVLGSATSDPNLHIIDDPVKFSFKT